MKDLQMNTSEKKIQIHNLLIESCDLYPCALTADPSPYICLMLVIFLEFVVQYGH